MKRIWKIGRHFLFVCPALVAVLLFWILPSFPNVTETVFSRGIFRLISVPLGALTALFPFSVTELLVLLALPLVLLLVFLMVRHLLTLKQVGKGAAWAVSVAFLLYALAHGLNFYRLPAAQLMKIDTTMESPAYLKEVCIHLAQQASLTRDSLDEDADGYTTLSVSKSEILRQADEGFHTLEKQYPFLWGGVWRTKPVLLSHFWSYTGITGMYFPFLCEANVNIDVPDSSIPATAAHELAHTRGFAREDECNFFAFLTSIHHPSPDYRYSGYVMAYIYCSNALFAYDKELWGETRAYCSEGMLRDLGQRNTYWKQFEGKVQDTSTSINNSFIQAHGEEEGVFSYERVVQLIVGYYKNNS